MKLLKLSVVNCFQIIIFVLTRTAVEGAFASLGCCELLSNHYLCANKNSYSTLCRITIGVVNCFQIIIFVLTRTAIMKSYDKGISCELLSNHYLCANKNSNSVHHRRAILVVNCFQIIIFVLTRTAQHVQRPMLQSIRSIVRNKKMLFFKTI